MMKIKINLVLIFAISSFLISCENDGYAGYDPGETVVQELSGEWFVKLYDQSGTALTGYSRISTYNTAQNTNEIWVDDEEHFFPLKVTASASIENLTFNTQNAENLYDEEAVATITDGKVIKNGTPASGTRVIVDSLAFTVELANDPDSPYLVAGYKRTGFFEDEH